MTDKQSHGRNVLTDPVEVRVLVSRDAAAIAACINRCFAHEGSNATAQRVEGVLSQLGHHTAGAFIGDILVGFCDSFVTEANGKRRWEIDLLGVVPDARGRGIARRLVADAVEAGHARRAGLARALVRIDNEAARSVFRSAGFEASPRHRLWTAEPITSSPFTSPVHASMIRVSTLTYDGIWVEAPESAQSLAAARLLADPHGTIVGAVLPDLPEPRMWAETAGYEQVGEYHWWIRLL